MYTKRIVYIDRKVKFNMNPIEKEDKLDSEHNKKSLTKEEIIEILNSEAVASLKKPLVGALNRLGAGMPLWIHLAKGFGFTLLLSAGLIGYYIQWNAEIKQRQAETTARAVEQLQKTIDRKIEWQIKLNNAMVSLKETRAFIVLDCQNKHNLSNYEQQKLRLTARFKGIKAFIGSDNIFDQTVLNKLRDFINFDGNVTDVCSQDAPSELAWRQYLIDINNLTGESIKKDEDKLNHLNSLKEK